MYLCIDLYIDVPRTAPMGQYGFQMQYLDVMYIDMRKNTLNNMLILHITGMYVPRSYKSNVKHIEVTIFLPEAQ